MLNKRLTATKLDDEDSHPTYHIQMMIPVPVIRNRSIITSFYEQENDDGSLILINSSQGNEAVVEANKKLIGKNVVADAIITYTKGEFYEGGCNIV